MTHRRLARRTPGARSGSSSPSRPRCCWRWRRLRPAPRRALLRLRGSAAGLGLPGPAVVHPAARPDLDRGRAALPGGAAALEILAVVGTVLLAVQFAGCSAGRGGQVLTAVVVAAPERSDRVGHRLSTATFDTLAWTAVLVLVTQAVVDDRPRLWMLAGSWPVSDSTTSTRSRSCSSPSSSPACSTGTRGRAPHAVAVHRGRLRALLWVRTSCGSGEHDWPVLDLSADIADEYGGIGGRIALLGEAISMYSPLIFFVWVIGAVQLLRGGVAPARLPAVRRPRRAVLFLSPAARATTSPVRSSPSSLPEAPGSPAAAPPVVSSRPVRGWRSADGRVARFGAGPARRDVRRLLLHRPQRRPGRDDRLGGYSAQVREIVARPPRAPSCSPATTGRPAPSSGTASAPPSSAGTTAGASSGDLRRRSSRGRRRPRPARRFLGCERSTTLKARWTSTTRRTADRLALRRTGRRLGRGVGPARALRRLSARRRRTPRAPSRPRSS